jgi:putative Ca2+/H+ antiporter (TMEM165/GDT1 family)
MAILSGDFIADKISVKTVNLIGGILFTFFGVIQGIYLLANKGE